MLSGNFKIKSGVVGPVDLPDFGIAYEIKQNKIWQ